MNIYTKKKIISILDSMDEAFQMLQLGDEETTYERCAMCQEAAVEIGNLIENKEEKADTVILLLEEYCELVYQVSIVNQTEQVKSHLLNRMYFIMEKVKYHVENKIEIQKTKVLFLPYNASMWDTFDSIYREALKEEQFHVVVMPIPYYNLGSNEEILSEEYDGLRFPSHVVITDYREYDLTLNHPDIIFIHNPYDNCNTVTRVKEQYFSSELIKYTDHLVYIPYYLSKSQTDDIMCTLPGVLNAWRVFVQSEPIRKQYLKYNQEEKVVALGSPKTDMLFRNKEEILESLPTEWENKLENRTTFFYNTHLHSVMTEAESHIQKLNYVMDFFKTRDDLAIIWRPHPLMKETIKTYNPQIMDDYLRIVKKFQELENGIYDDTEDLYRTISLSDAYIGDASSSVVSLFGSTGKPMLYLNNTHIFNHKRLETIRTLSAVVINEKVWQFSVEYNALFELNLVTLENRYVTSLDEYHLADNYLYMAAVANKNKVFFLPCLANKLAILDTITEKIEYIELLFLKHRDCNFVIVGNQLWLFPVYYSDKIYVINMDTYQVISKPSRYEKIFTDWDKILDIPLFYGACLVEDQVWRVCRVAPFIWMYDLKKETMVIFPINGSINPFKSITFDGTDFWLLPTGNGSVVKWNKVLGVQKEYKDYPEAVKESNGMLFTDIVYYKGSVWLLPQQSQRIVTIDILTEDITEIDFHTDNFLIDYEDANAFSSYFIERNFLYLFPYQSNVLLKIDMDSQEIEEIDNKMPIYGEKEEWIEKMVHEVGRKIHSDNLSHVYFEEVYSLDSFAEYVQKKEDFFMEERKEYFTKNSLNVDGTCGKKIWEYTKKKFQIECR